MLTLAKIIFIVVAILMILVVLMQSSKTPGLSGAISGGAEQIVGRKARGLDAVLARVTTVLGVLFFGSALWVAWIIAHHS